MTNIEVGGYIYTPRFLQCRISAIFDNEKIAYDCGFTEPTHFDSTDMVYDVYGKSVGVNRMIFACVLNKGV